MAVKSWQQKEKGDAKDFGGKRVAGSGNKWYRPGDVRSDKFLIESKDTDKKSYSLSKERLDKLYEEGLFAEKIPVMSINIQGFEVVVMMKQDFLDLQKKLETS